MNLKSNGHTAKCMQEEEKVNALNANTVIGLSTGSDDGGSDDGGDGTGTGSSPSTARRACGKGTCKQETTYTTEGGCQWNVSFILDWNATGWVDGFNTFGVTAASFGCTASFIGKKVPQGEIQNGTVYTTSGSEGKASATEALIRFSATTEKIPLAYTIDTYENGQLASSKSGTILCTVECVLNLSCMGSTILGDASFTIL